MSRSGMGDHRAIGDRVNSLRTKSLSAFIVVPLKSYGEN
jgi:hypothetical protein